MHLDPYYFIVAPVFLLIVTILVAAHELGHYLFAKLNKMDVEEFAIGFGKKPILTWLRRGDTVFTIRPWPLGGFVRIRGMVPEEDGSEISIPNGFYSKSPLQRLSVLFAGPLFSVLAGMILLFGIYATVGEQLPSRSAVFSDVVPNGPAARAGLQPKDRVMSLDGVPVTSWSQMSEYVQKHPLQDVKLKISRGNSLFDVVVRTEKSKMPMPLMGEDGPTGYTDYVGLLGVQAPGYELRPVSVDRAAASALKAPLTMVRGVISIFYVPKSFQESMGGPATMIAVTYASAKSGIYQILLLAAELSISLGILNLLPVPPLDGGQMMIAFAELFRRGRRLSFELQNFVNSVGFALVGVLVISVIWVDIKRWFIHDNAGSKTPPPIALPKK